MQLPSAPALIAFLRGLPKNSSIRMKEGEPFQVEVKGETIECSRHGHRLRKISHTQLEDYLSRAAQLPEAEQLKPSAYEPRQEQSYFVAILGAYELGGSEAVPPLPEECVPRQFIEGAQTQTTLNRHERDPAARKACIESHGCTCSVCQVPLERIYGFEAKGLIHVHHLKPLAAAQDAQTIDPVKDLVPVCPNCHAVIHFRRSAEEPRTIEDVRKLIREAKSK